MRRYLCVLGVLVLGAAGCSRAVDVEQERTALLEADRQWAQSVNDVDLFMSYWAPDATAFPAGRPAVRGADAIRKTVSEIRSAPGFSLSWTADRAEVASGGDVGYTTGTYEMTVNGAKDRGKYLTVWKKQPEGTWKVAEDIFNSDLPPQGPPPPHAMVAPGAVTWEAGPPNLPPGVELAVISGDPSQAQPFVIRGRVPLHWHPTTENITVLSGTVALGMGDGGSEQALAAGGLAVVPAEMRHFFMAKTAATFQVHGMGPFAVNHVNPADDPSKK